VVVLAFPGCPNRAGAITLVERGYAELGSNAEIQILDITDQQTAEQARSLGSPTIRVNGRDIEPGAEECIEYLHTCRLYQGKHSLRGLPRRPGCVRPCRPPKRDVGNWTWRPCHRGRHVHTNQGVTLDLGPN
jgi:hypothetical protein